MIFSFQNNFIRSYYYRFFSIFVVSFKKLTYVLSFLIAYKDYDEIKVTVNPYSIDILSPNPADNQVTINYKAQEASSAYFMLISATNGTSDNYIIDTSVFETTLDISNYQPGIYHISLVCDGEVVDSKNLVIE